MRNFYGFLYKENQINSRKTTPSVRIRQTRKFPSQLYKFHENLYFRQVTLKQNEAGGGEDEARKISILSPPPTEKNLHQVFEGAKEK